MSASVFRDGTYQSVSEKEYNQQVPGAVWRPGIWIDDENRIPQRSLPVLEAGVQLVAYAFRLVPPTGRPAFLAGTRVRFRIQRYPIDPNDNGTWWTGYLPATGAAFYYAATFPDLKGGDLGHRYGADLMTTKRLVVDQFKLVLFPVTALGRVP